MRKRPPKKPLTQEEIAEALRAWKRYQSDAWDKFRQSLTPEQERLLQEYRYVTSVIRRLRNWQMRARRGIPIWEEIPTPPD